jgi:hypothetical protein
MSIPQDFEKLIKDRISEVVAILRAAVHVDVAHFVWRSIEDRLQVRTDFAARLAPARMAALRERAHEEVSRVLEEIGVKLYDLRTFLGASPRSASDESEAMVNVLSVVMPATARVLTDFGFPPDGEDGKAPYRMLFAPSPPVLWAWAELRGLETARHQIADGGVWPPQSTPEIRLHLPEALV